MIHTCTRTVYNRVEQKRGLSPESPLARRALPIDAARTLRVAVGLGGAGRAGSGGEGAGCSKCNARSRTESALKAAAASAAAIVAARCHPLRPATLVAWTICPGGPAAPYELPASSSAVLSQRCVLLLRRPTASRLPIVAARMRMLFPRRATHEIVASAVPWISSSEDEASSWLCSLSSWLLIPYGPRMSTLISTMGHLPPSAPMPTLPFDPMVAGRSGCHRPTVHSGVPLPIPARVSSHRGSHLRPKVAQVIAQGPRLALWSTNCLESRLRAVHRPAAGGRACGCARSACATPRAAAT